MSQPGTPIGNRFEQAGMWGQLAETEEIREKIRHFREMVPEEVETVLDVGCGDGAITDALARDLTVTGVDLSEAALANVKVAATRRASATALPFPDASFDLVLSSQVLEHLSDADYRQALAEIRRTARRFVLLSVPYREDLAFRRVRCPQCGSRHHVWGHLRSFTIDGLLRDLSGATARDVRLFGTPEAPAWPRPLLWLLHNGLHCFYEPVDQSPLCPSCGNREYVGRARGLPVTAWRIKRALTRRLPSRPFWVAVLFELPEGT